MTVVLLLPGSTAKRNESGKTWARTLAPIDVKGGCTQEFTLCIPLDMRLFSRLERG